jgi:hypothetical protein
VFIGIVNLCKKWTTDCRIINTPIVIVRSRTKATELVIVLSDFNTKVYLGRSQALKFIPELLVLL